VIEESLEQYIHLDVVLRLHAEVMEQTGDPIKVLRDKGGLESALNRAQQAASYEGADLILQAVRLCVGISQAHPFVDGNKRTALAVTDAFLRFNGYAFPPEKVVVADWLEKIAKELDRYKRDYLITNFEMWLREVVIEVPIEL
jgi:death on curing protein